MKQVRCIKELCLGCHQCEFACIVAHSSSKSVYSVIKETGKHVSGITIRTDTAGTSAIPVKCRHCNPAPCINVCLAGAIYRDFCTGYVIIDEQYCTGCKRCLNACPFNVIGYGMSQKSGSKHLIAIKCDECINDIRIGAEPACVSACKSGALLFCDADEKFREKKKNAVNQIKGVTHNKCKQ
ncbi:MAG: 4Fe-4S dicluster domain-containing protein [Chitinispirillaceae bacterium]|nr:4Fe-4S dicluster domain-containing protein [Chitinispirillaceae bacterium]